MSKRQRNLSLLANEKENDLMEFAKYYNTSNLVEEMQKAENGGTIMEKKIIDFGINSYGGYYIKYSDGTTRTLCKEQFIKILNREIS